jgi:small subunit ribosomal protein S16
MSTRIRLRRMGSKQRPFYRVVVADQRSPRDGRFIEIIGRYHPLNDPSVIEIDEARALHWLMVGAQPSDQVRNLMSKVGIWEKFVAERPGATIAATPRDERPARPKLSKKAQAKAEEAERVVEVPETPPQTEAPAPGPEAASEDAAEDGPAEPEAASPEPETPSPEPETPSPEPETPSPEPEAAADATGSDTASPEPASED